MAQPMRVLVAAILLATPLSMLAQSAAPTPAPAATTPGQATPDQAAPPAPAGPTPLDKILFTGAGDYPAADLLHIVHLHTGDLATQEMLKAAVQSLFATGLFDSVNANVAMDGSTHVLDFVVKPVSPDALCRVSYANLVWFKTTTLDSTIAQSVPLFGPRIPCNGDMATRAVPAIVAMLKTRGVTAAVEASLLGPSERHPYRAIQFRITDPPIRLTSINVTGGPVSMLNTIVAAQKRATQEPYNEGIAGLTLTDILLGPLQDAGYLSARLMGEHLQRANAPDGIELAYAANISQGVRYRVGAISFTPSAVFTLQDFAHASQLHAGTIPSDDALANTRAAVLAAFHRQGYVDAQLLIQTQLNATTATANYTFSVIPGDIYRLKSVAARGLDAAAQKAFDENFKLQAGQVFDEPYVANFLADNPNVAALQGYGFTYQSTINPETHEVDLVIDFARAK